MRCSDLVQLVTDYLEGALAADERRSFEEHLAGCASCTEYVEQMRETVARLGDADPEPLSEERCSQLLEIFHDVHGRSAGENGAAPQRATPSPPKGPGVKFRR